MDKVYQHYLPVVYIKKFKRLNQDGFATYAFDKKTPSKQQIKNGYIPRKPSEICGDKFRHTMWALGEDKFLLEDFFNKLENEHNDFVDLVYGLYLQSYISFVYRKLKIKIVKKRKLNKITNIQGRLIYSKCMAFRVNVEMIRQYVIFISKFYLFRLKKMDSLVEFKKKQKISKIMSFFESSGVILRSNVGRDVYDAIDGDSLSFHINNDDISGFNQIIKLIGPMAMKSKVKDIRHVLNKFYRYVIYPLKNMQLNSKCIYFLRTKEYIVSGDMPFSNFKYTKGDGNIVAITFFTLTPNLLIAFSDEDIGEYVFFDAGLTKKISAHNFKNAEQYVFSNDLKLLIEICDKFK